MAKYLMGDSPSLRKVYVVRHGATALNAQNGDGSVDKIRGWSDVPLSDKGQEQAEKLGKKLKDSGIDVIYHSPFSRATDTAQHISNNTGAPMVPVEHLKPWDVGELTGVESKTAHPTLERYAREQPNQPIPGGESFNNFKNRFFTGLKQILNQGDNLPAIVTHHRVERMIQAWLKGGQKQDLTLDMGEMLKHGEPTGHAEIVHIQPHKLEPDQHLVRSLLSQAR